jgi:hypothetical protein
MELSEQRYHKERYNLEHYCDHFRNLTIVNHEHCIVHA